MKIDEHLPTHNWHSDRFCRWLEVNFLVFEKLAPKIFEGLFYRSCCTP